MRRVHKEEVCHQALDFGLGNDEVAGPEPNEPGCPVPDKGREGNDGSPRADTLLNGFNKLLKRVRPRSDRIDRGSHQTFPTVDGEFSQVLDKVG
jgi:hypothetical protein